MRGLQEIFLLAPQTALMNVADGRNTGFVPKASIGPFGFLRSFVEKASQICAYG